MRQLDRWMTTERATWMVALLFACLLSVWVGLSIAERQRQNQEALPPPQWVERVPTARAAIDHERNRRYEVERLLREATRAYARCQYDKAVAGVTGALPERDRRVLAALYAGFVWWGFWSRAEDEGAS